MKFSDIEGHDNVKNVLRAMADGHRLAHAVMLSGPSGVGKMMLARAFAQYIHCASPRDGEPCGVCASCRQHERLENPDLHFIYPVVKSTSPKRGLSTDYLEEWKRMLLEEPYMGFARWLSILDAGNKQPTIYADDADAISASAMLSPMQQDLKIYIIWLPEKMQTSAANKLLKLIEEPYADTMFILVSNDARSVLPTVFSRVQRFNLLPLPDNIIAGSLEARGLDHETACSLAALSGGSMGEALELYLHNEENGDFAELFRTLMRAAYGRKIPVLRQLADICAEMGREKLRRFLAYCARMVRENFIYNLRMPQLTMMSPDEERFSFRFAPFIHHANVEEMLRQFSLADNDVSRNANPKIVIFSLSMHLCRLIRTVKPDTTYKT